jgi:hypothetical protein
MDLQRAPAGALFFAHARIAGMLFLKMLEDPAKPYGVAFAKGCDCASGAAVSAASGAAPFQA